MHLARTKYAIYWKTKFAKKFCHMQWFICNLQNMFSLITKVSKVDTDQNVCEVQSAISGPKCPKQQWRQFLSKENVSPGILYQEGSLRNVDSTFTFTISQVLGQDISFCLMTTILRNCQATQNTTYDPWFVIVRMKNSFSCLTFGLKILPIDFESLEKLVSGGIFSIRSFSDKTNYILPCQEKDRTPAHIWEVVFSFLVSLRSTSWMISSEVVKLFLR